MKKTEKSYWYVETWHQAHADTAGCHGDIGKAEGA